VVRETIVASCIRVCGPIALLLGEAQIVIYARVARWCPARLVMRGDQLH
jgi:hypothetical protein